MTAVGITVDGEVVFGPASAWHIEVALPPALYGYGHEFVLSRCKHCRTAVRQNVDGTWVDTVDSTQCNASVPIEHLGGPTPPAKVRSVELEIGALLGVRVHVDGWRYPVEWHFTEDGFHRVDPLQHREFRIIQPEARDDL